MTAAGGRTGRPPLTEERKAEIRLDIARAAVDLFVNQGVTATTGEQIGQAVGISARTVWRYFPSKEACVRPLFTAGIDLLADRLRQWGPGEPLDEIFTPALTTDLRVGQGPDRATVGALVRLTRTEPGLRAVWLQTHDEAEPAFARALAERAGLPADDLRSTIQAAMFNAALRAAVEHYAWHDADAGLDRTAAEAALERTLREALITATEGLT
ncbi:TetR family transcriptional regulator [Streptomyces griseoviridis]|uniref:TetR family transcriptional regulator n=1 Tax=Streptomyces griseoviridis TaxID=45398 RepID=A0A3S9ZMX1_STRGD|nr:MULTISPECIES: TetR/AcrR family transcriptional regulator [Streptomyces]AZS89104.1 TetR family transcriptional regulator [Streptomyces griseoviridis]MDH6697789.1 AcrR family transcriptional regulator [Streptomyces sp. MAA16]QCN84047.1 TetR family transcriptional regulator [Streptomyces griseoviridis]